METLERTTSQIAIIVDSSAEALAYGYTISLVD
jgi:hypothetical protein